MGCRLFFSEIWAAYAQCISWWFVASSSMKESLRPFLGAVREAHVTTSSISRSPRITQVHLNSFFRTRQCQIFDLGSEARTDKVFSMRVSRYCHPLHCKDTRIDGPK